MDWEKISSIVTALAAIVALFISVAQIWMSNRQHLLDRRLRLWSTAHGLMELCAKNRSLLEKKGNAPQFANALEFLWMTNNSLFYDISPAIYHVLEQDWQPRFLAKLEELNKMAFEIELVFKGRSAKTLSVFITNYASLLRSMYQYQIMLNHLHETAERFHYDQEQAISAVGEERQRVELYEAMSKLLNSFDELTPSVIKKIAGQCKLSR